MSAAWRFRACGLSIHSDAPIQGLRPRAFTGLPDLQVRMRGTVNSPHVDHDGALWYRSPYSDDRQVPLLTIRVRGSSYLLSYAEGARFLVNASGAEVDAWWDPPLTEVDAADYLLGSVLAFILRLRGAVPLHASAVVIDERAVLFAGSPGAGKSSSAAAFARLGYPVLSDDIVVIADEAGLMMAHPSHGHLSVWPDSARALFAADSLPQHSAVYAKHRVDLIERGYRFHESAVPIDTIFVLSPRSPASRVVAREMRPRAALMALVGQTYGNYLLDGSMRAREFDLLGRLAGAVRVSELAFSDGLDDLVPSCRTLALQFATGVGGHLKRTPLHLQGCPL
jgi:hypothetical protein